MSLEELIPSNQSKSHHVYAILIRTGLVISTLLVALSIPFFGLVMSLIGSLLTMLVDLDTSLCLLPKYFEGKNNTHSGVLCTIVITVGVISSSFGTYSALSKIIENLTS
ncbi:Amino acid transporter, transmembrane domain containing protein [Trema orientale]|uniref:Amino acid transporter, transmembrane domain containing protein n=1 Tax=Trema orientale TaxID=63057 RepID=A0A2P5AYW0_TREOI|nr:Amino acid transporter, transmembrane domain containing protein [Trema orientale]